MLFFLYIDDRDKNEGFERNFFLFFSWKFLRVPLSIIHQQHANFFEHHAILQSTVEIFTLQFAHFCQLLFFKRRFYYYHHFLHKMMIFIISTCFLEKLLRVPFDPNLIFQTFLRELVLNWVIRNLKFLLNSKAVKLFRSSRVRCPYFVRLFGFLDVIKCILKLILPQFCHSYNIIGSVTLKIDLLNLLKCSRFWVVRILSFLLGVFLLK